MMDAHGQLFQLLVFSWYLQYEAISYIVFQNWASTKWMIPLKPPLLYIIDALEFLIEYTISYDYELFDHYLYGRADAHIIKLQFHIKILDSWRLTSLDLMDRTINYPITRCNRRHTQ